MSLNPRKQIQTFLSAGRVARVVQVHQDHVEVAGLERRDVPGGRVGGFDAEPFAFKQQTQGFQYIRLIVGDENPSGRVHALSESSAP